MRRIMNKNEEENPWMRMMKKSWMRLMKKILNENDEENYDWDYEENHD